MHKFLLVLALVLTPLSGFAQSVEVDDSGTSANAPADANQKAGKSEASKYFQFRHKNNKAEGSKDTASDSGAKVNDARPHYMTVHVGTFFTDHAYQWGRTDANNKNVGQFQFGVTYRLGEWVNVADFAIRAEYVNYILDNGHAQEISISPILIFPDSNSRFPLYFGIGVGPGFFLQQTRAVSPVSIDYQLLGGIRILDLLGHVGFMLEAGMRNGILLVSPGQYNSVFVNFGAVFAF